MYCDRRGKWRVSPRLRLLLVATLFANCSKNILTKSKHSVYVRSFIVNLLWFDRIKYLYGAVESLTIVQLNSFFGNVVDTGIAHRCGCVVNQTCTFFSGLDSDCYEFTFFFCETFYSRRQFPNGCHRWTHIGNWLLNFPDAFETFWSISRSLLASYSGCVCVSVFFLPCSSPGRLKSQTIDGQ